MIYMLDTNICSYIIRNKPESIKKRLEDVEKENIIGLSSVVVSELFYGAYKKGSDALIKLIKTFIDNFKIYNYDVKSAIWYGKLRTELENKGIIIGAYDLQIAAHAISLNAILVTNNVKEFNRIQNLKIENWVDF